MAEIERDDLLLDQLLQSRRSSLEQQKASRQNFILVASLLDRIPNLAGLARTCEVSYLFCCCLIYTFFIFIFYFWRKKAVFSVILFSFFFCIKQVFRASGLAISDSKVMNDKQFQLIRF